MRFGEAARLRYVHTKQQKRRQHCSNVAANIAYRQATDQAKPAQGGKKRSMASRGIKKTN